MQEGDKYNFPANLSGNLSGMERGKIETRVDRKEMIMKFVLIKADDFQK